MVRLITDVPHIYSCAKLHEFSTILAWLFVLNDSLFIKSLSLIVVHNCLKFYFHSFILLIFLVHLIFIFLKLKNSRSYETNGNNFHFSYENSSAALLVV